MRKRIDFIESRLDILEKALKEAMSKPFFERSLKTVQFLYTEKKIFTALYKEIKYILYGEETGVGSVGYIEECVGGGKSKI